jgi:hypothetical protein
MRDGIRFRQLGKKSTGRQSVILPTGVRGDETAIEGLALIPGGMCRVVVGGMGRR